MINTRIKQFNETRTVKPATPLCWGCTRLRAGTTDQCQAFMSGIPEEIMQNQFDHRQPYEGDNGMTYEPRSNIAARAAELHFNPGSANRGN